MREALKSYNGGWLGEPKWFDEGLVRQALKLLPTPEPAGRDAEMQKALDDLHRIIGIDYEFSPAEAYDWLMENCPAIQRALTQPSAEVDL